MPTIPLQAQGPPPVLADLLVEQPRLGRRPAARGQCDSTRTTRTAPCTGTVSTSPMRSLACGLSVGCRLMRIEPPAANARAIARCAHEPGAPEPLVQPLPVAVLGVRHDGCPLALQRRQCGEWAMRGLRVASGSDLESAAAARRRRSGSSMAGAGGPYSSAARHLGRHNPEAETAQHHRQQFGLQRESRCQARRHSRGTTSRRPGQFGGDPLGDIEPQQHRPRLQPAHRIGKSGGPVRLAAASRPDRAAASRAPPRHAARPTAGRA